MRGFFLTLIVTLTMPLLAQALKVRLTPETIYAGDAFRMEVSLDEGQIHSVTPTFSMQAQVIGQSQQVMIVNGHQSMSLILHVLPQEVGTCRLESLTATLPNGKTLTYQQAHEVKVRELLPDAAVSVSVSYEPEAPLPGDEVTVLITAKAPAIEQNGKFLSPFLSQSFFGGVDERLPNISFNAEVGEESPLRLLAMPQLQERTVDNGTMVWKVAIPYQAVRVGEQTFPAPVIRDTRYTLNKSKGQLEEHRCVTMGQPITIDVKAPPEEGRPEGFVGAVATSFEAVATLDALNVKVGDPVALTLTFKTDAASEQIRAPSLPSLKGFRLYGDPKRTTFEGGCSFTYPLRPIQQGLLEIPALPIAWFDKQERVYRQQHTIAVPLYAHPSAQLVLLGDDGEQFASVLPPALRLDDGEATHTVSKWALLALCLGVLACICRLCGSALLRFGCFLMQPVLQRRPAFKACTLLKRAQTPSEALAALREWSGRPALTSSELRTLLPDSPDAIQAVTAMAHLERAVYVGGEDFQGACQTLIDVLPKLPRLTIAKNKMRLLLFLLVTLLPMGVTAEPISFLREQATFVTLSASTPQDYVRAANLWLEVFQQGEMQQSALLNAASCALFARHPGAAEQMIQRYEILYGSDDESEQVILAAAEQLERTPFWGRTIFGFHYRFSYTERLNCCCWVGACFLLLCALSGKRVQGGRISTAIICVILIVSVCISANQLYRTQTLTALPVGAEVEAE